MNILHTHNKIHWCAFIHIYWHIWRNPHNSSPCHPHPPHSHPRLSWVLTTWNYQFLLLVSNTSSFLDTLTWVCASHSTFILCEYQNRRPHLPRKEITNHRLVKEQCRSKDTGTTHLWQLLLCKEHRLLCLLSVKAFSVMNHYICKKSNVKQNCLVIYSKITKQNTTRCEERKSNYYAHIYIETSIK